MKFTKSYAYYNAFFLNRNLKYLAPLSMVANTLIFIAISITIYYLVTDIPDLNERPAIVSIDRMPKFFGTVIFALEGGVLLRQFV